jgi:hypothetical protein
MSATHLKYQPLNSNESDVPPSSLGRLQGRSAAAKLIELGITFAVAASRAPMPGVCCRCGGYRNPRTSTAQCPNVFCSQVCEQDFVRSALAAVTVEDCIRIRERLETLMIGVQEPAI